MKFRISIGIVQMKLCERRKIVGWKPKGEPDAFSPSYVITTV